MKPLIVRKAARIEVRSIRQWYDNEAAGLGARFLAELDDVVARLRSTPQQFPVVRKSIRRALLHRFPYSVYFVDHTDAIILFAVLHHRRNPADWKHRASREETDE
ncbi:MAG TPA: type II toxin-antitoxin system RelE/ParE family toxin [Thermoanaerobaculia bacterium]|nr:type II toxin-antitoxin system RelE/ParE family toxin [Thermoanaerobaculia bacterium]